MTENHIPPANEPEETGKKKTKKLYLWGVIVLLLLLLPLTALTFYVSGYEAIFPNVYVGDINLSGKTEAEALALLDKAYNTQNIKESGFSVSCEDMTESLSVEDLGIVFRNQDTAKTAMAVGDVKNPVVKAVRFLKQVFSTTNQPPLISYNQELVKNAITTVSAPYDIEPVGYTFEIDRDAVTIHAPVAGCKVDRDAVIGQVEEQIRNMALSDLVLEHITTQPEPINFEEFYTWLTSPAEDAYYTKGEDGKIFVNREKLQCSVDKEAVQAAVSEIESSGKQTATFAVTTTAPKKLSANLSENLYKDKLGSYTTYFSGTAARNNNVRLATSRVNGYELMPGEEFSYDKTILPRTSANGYMAAPVYIGNKVESGLGGGICQPSSTLYGAALYANLEILERHNHSMLVSYMPAGLDATIAQGALDLRLKNNTPYPVKISGSANGGVLTFSIWGYNPEKISVDVLRSGGGFTYSATRVVKKDGVEIKRESLGTSRYVEPEPSETPEPTESTEPTENPEGTEAPPAGGGTEPTVSAPPEGTGNPPAESTPPYTVPTATPTPQPSAAPVPTGTTLSE